MQSTLSTFDFVRFPYQLIGPFQRLGMLVHLQEGPAEALHHVPLEGARFSLQRLPVVLLGRLEIPLGICRLGGELWLDIA